METKNYTGRIEAAITAEAAFEGINRVCDWWTANLEGSSERLSDVFITHFRDTFTTMKITESVPGKKITWLVTDCYLAWLKDKHEWTGTEIKIEISSTGSSTAIDMTHVGLVPEVECYNDCEKGWNFYIKESLRKLLTEGTGRPDTPQIKR